ncbi:MAG: hypothetical protein EOM50_19420 [Erysipelotrichia bacterium]|nr:hypothetical protein [Erysipelotrichia bacterium]
MLSDLMKISKKIYKPFIEEGMKPYSLVSLYDSLRSLEKVIDALNVLANHYLALRLDESFLISSSFGSPTDKWRLVLNKDLEEFNHHVKNYLLIAQGIAFIDPNNKEERVFILEECFNEKVYYSFVRDHYNVGYLKQNMKEITCHILTNTYNKENFHLSKNSTIDVSTYEKRKALQEELLNKIETLKHMRHQVADFICSNYTIDDLIRR